MTKRLPLLLLLLAGIGCARSDARLSNRVEDRLAWRAAIPPGTLFASAREGVLTLTGVVPTAEAKDQALRVARETSGVRSVVDEIRVASDGNPGDISASSPTGVTGAMPPGGRSPAASPPTTAGNTDHPRPR